MTSNPQKAFATSDSINSDHSAFLNDETISEPADPDNDDPDALNKNSSNPEEICQISVDPNTDTDAERERRMMSRTPQ